MKRIFALCLVAIALTGCAGTQSTGPKMFGAQATVLTGDPNNKTSLDTNFTNTQANFTELYGRLNQAVNTTSSPVFSAVSLGVASTTTGLLNFYGNAKAFPFGLFSQGADAPGIGWRLPSTMPAGTYLISVDTNGYLDYVNPTTLTAITAAGFDGNLSTGTDTIQELAQAVDDLVLGGAASISDTEYNEATWDNVTDVAPSKNTVRDALEALPSLTIQTSSISTGATNILGSDYGLIADTDGDGLPNLLDSGISYPSSTSTSTATGNINIDGASADHYYFNNGASAATYTPVITSPPASNKERAIVLTVGGGAGVITMTWTNVSFLGTAGAATTTTNKYSHYGCFIRSSGNAICKIIAEAADY